jgi:hypothetical protein
VGSKRDELYLATERLNDRVQAKFQYILDLQGRVINIDTSDPKLVADLVLVVNEHGVILGDMMRFLRALSATVGDLLEEESKRAAQSPLRVSPVTTGLGTATDHQE